MATSHFVVRQFPEELVPGGCSRQKVTVAAKWWAFPALFCELGSPEREISLRRKRQGEAGRGSPLPQPLSLTNSLLLLSPPRFSSQPATRRSVAHAQKS